MSREQVAAVEVEVLYEDDWCGGLGHAGWWYCRGHIDPQLLVDAVWWEHEMLFLPDEVRYLWLRWIPVRVDDRWMRGSKFQGCPGRGAFPVTVIGEGLDARSIRRAGERAEALEENTNGK